MVVALISGGVVAYFMIGYGLGSFVYRWKAQKFDDADDAKFLGILVIFLWPLIFPLTVLCTVADWAISRWDYKAEPRKARDWIDSPRRRR